MHDVSYVHRNHGSGIVTKYILWRIDIVSRNLFVNQWDVIIQLYNREWNACNKIWLWDAPLKMNQNFDFELDIFQN